MITLVRIDSLRSYPEKILARLRAKRWFFYLSKLALLFSISLFVLVQIQFVTTPWARRALPAEVDDSYAYLIKATQLFEVDTRHSPAYKDLKAQLTLPTDSSDGRDAAWIRYNERHRLTAIFSPLHSALIAGVYAALEFLHVPISWEDAFFIVSLLGAIFQATCILLLLSVLVGQGGMLSAALLLSFVTLPNHGFHYVVPSTLAMASGLLVIRSVLLRQTGVGFILACVAAVSFHPLGQIYVAIGLGLLLLQCRLHVPAFISKGWVGLLVVVAALVFPMLFPENLGFSRDPLKAGMTWASGLYINFAAIKDIIAETFQGGIIAIFVGALIGLCYLSLERRRTFLQLALVCCLALILSPLYVLPQFPGELFSRLLPLAMIMLLGAAGSGITFLVHFTVASTASMLRRPGHAPVKTVHALGLFGTIIFASVLSSALERLALDRAHRSEILEKASLRFDYQFDPKSVHAMLARLPAQKSVLYPSEEPMHFALIHGLSKAGAVYLPLVSNPADRAAWLDERIGGIFSFSPLFRAPGDGVRANFSGLYNLTSGVPVASKDGILLQQHDRLSIESKVGKLQVWHELTGRLAQEDLSAITRILAPLSTRFQVRAKALRDGTLVADETFSCEDSFACTLPEALRIPVSTLLLQMSRPLRVVSLREESVGQLSNWPWGRGVSVGIQGSDLKTTSNVVALAPPNFDMHDDWQVVDDSGSLLVLTRKESH